MMSGLWCGWCGNETEYDKYSHEDGICESCNQNFIKTVTKEQETND